jgi:hypothetical protein
MDRRWLARGLVIALHAGLLAALWLHRGPSRDATSERRLTTVRLLPPERATPRTSQPPPRLPPATRAPVPAAPRLPDLPDEPAPVSTAITLPPPETAPPAEPPRTALRLTLPPGHAASASVRSAALNDPRSNTRRQTFEDRIANAAAATGDWVEERAGDGRMRRRRGDTCVETEESRIAVIDRFNENVAPRTAKMTGKPYKCPP